MPRPKKLREPGDTRVRKAWNKKKTRKYTIAITLDEKKEKRRKKTATKVNPSPTPTLPSSPQSPPRTPKAAEPRQDSARHA